MNVIGLMIQMKRGHQDVLSSYYLLLTSTFWVGAN